MSNTQGQWLGHSWPSIVSILLIVALSHASGAESDNKEQPQAEQYRHFLERNLKIITREGEAVRFEATVEGKVGKYDPRRHQWTTSFIVDEGDSFFQRNHHARVEFTVQAIGEDDVTLKARSLVTPRDRDNQADKNIMLKLPYRERGSDR